MIREKRKLIPFVQAPDVEHLLIWKDVCEAIVSGHHLAAADIDDIMFKHEQGTLLSRAAWVPGMGIGVKTATVFPGNINLQPALPNTHTIFTMLDDLTGVPVALIDGDLVTRWKTAADSVLGARLLARPDSKILLIVGAGVVAQSLVEAYTEVFPALEQIFIWNRNIEKAQKLALSMSRDSLPVAAVSDLAGTVSMADIVSSATMSIKPILKGEWFKSGTHVDLIGAFRPDMREADDELIRKAEIFVDSRKTAIHDIGELNIPLQNGVIRNQDIRGDFYDLCNGGVARSSSGAITLFKNGGGAHMDLMTARYIFQIYQATENQASV